MNENLRDRLWDLLADKATVGLTPPEEAELRALVDQYPDVDTTEMDRIAALLEPANPLPGEQLPAHLREQIEREAVTSPPFADAPASLFQRSEPRRSSWLALTGWLATAAALLLLLGVWYANRPVPAVSVEVARARLLEKAGTLRLDGKALNDTPGVGGDVTWNNTTQEGFLRLQGLPVNDPGKQQYQLWIVDAGRDQRYPVDGGVFDISRTGAVIVPIRTPLPIRQPAAFLITREPAGGVVVSDRKDAWFLAAVPPA